MPTRAGVPRWGRRVPVSRCDRESRIPGSSRMIPAYPGLKLLIDLTVRAPARSLNHTKWACQYHVVFIPKYRKKVIYGTA